MSKTVDLLSSRKADREQGSVCERQHRCFGGHRLEGRLVLVSEDDGQDLERQGQRRQRKEDPCTVSPEAPEHEGREIGKQRKRAVRQPASRRTEADRERAPSLAPVERSILEVVDKQDVRHKR